MAESKRPTIHCDGCDGSTHCHGSDAERRAMADYDPEGDDQEGERLTPMFCIGGPADGSVQSRVLPRRRVQVAHSGAMHSYEVEYLEISDYRWPFLRHGEMAPADAFRAAVAVAAGVAEKTPIPCVDGPFRGLLFRAERVYPDGAVLGLWDVAGQYHRYVVAYADGTPMLCFSTLLSPGARTLAQGKQSG